MSFFNGHEVDSKFIIERFKELVKLIPKDKKPETKMKTVSLKPTKKLAKQTALKSVGGVHTNTWVKKHIKKKFPKTTESTIDRFIQFMNSPQNPIPPEVWTLSRNLLEEFASYQVGTDIKEEESKLPEDEKSADADIIDKIKKKSKKVVSTILETETSRHQVLVKNKSLRLAETLKKQYNFKSDTKLPKGLEVEFMAAYPEDEDAVLEKYKLELDAQKVKTDADDATGIVKKELESSDLLDKMNKLANSRVKLRKSLEKQSEALIAPTAIVDKLKENPRGKLRKGGKKTKKSDNIQSIKVVI